MAISPLYESTRGAAGVPAKIAQRAVEWLVELQSNGRTPERLVALQHWRAEHPDHEFAWQRIEAVVGTLQQVSTPAGSVLAHATLAPARSASRRRAVKMLSVLIFSGGAAGLAAQRLPWRSWTADYRTDIGQQRTVALSDGTQVALDTNSAIDVRYDDLRRHIRLIQGEILVTSAKDMRSPSRPLSVATSDGLATALGTRFSVRKHDGFTQVGVFQGAVRLEPALAPSSSSSSSTASAPTLQAGQQGRFDTHAVSLSALDPDSAAWHDGFIVVKQMRLATFIEELNRYTPSALSYDPSVADLRVSGSYPIRDIDAVLDTVAVVLSLDVQRTQRFWGSTAMRLAPHTRQT